MTDAATVSEAAETPLVRELRGQITILTMMHRPHNLIGPTLLDALGRELAGAKDAGSRAIVIRSGLRHFSAGAEIAIFTGRVAAASSGQSQTNFKGAEFLRMVELLPIPIVASVHGVCLGGGLEVALACDYIVSAASAKFGSVEATIGLHPLLGAIQRQVRRMGAARAKEMAMLGRRYDAATLERWGLINLVVPDEKLDEATMAIAEELARGPTVAHAATKRLVHIAVNQGVSAADEAMPEVQEPIWASEDLKIGLRSYQQNGPGLAKFQGR